MDNQGTISNNNEITEEASSGTTSNDDEITEEGTTSNNAEIIEEGATINNDEITKEGTTNNNNEITEEDNVMVFVAYNGKWEWDGKEWLFKDSKGSIMVVSKYVTLSEITDNLCTELDVDQVSYGLKLEVHYRVGSPWFPIIEIKCDKDLSLFISESSKTKPPLCVTAVLKDDVAKGVGKDEINPDIKEESPLLRKDGSVENILIKAIKKGNWVKAREIVKTGEIDWTTKLDDNGMTALHFAVGKYANMKAAKDILKGLNPELLVNILDNDGQNPAHVAASFGNTEALKIISDSNPKCLFIPDKAGDLAIVDALDIFEIKTFLYLFKQMKSNKDEFKKFLEGVYGLQLLHQVIDIGLIDVAYELICEDPSMATAVYDDDDETPLEWIVERPELFYSGSHYNLCQRFVYHHVPIENDRLGSTHTADLENQETPKMDKFVTKHKKRCLHNVISWICVKLWETALRHVPYVKHLKDEKVKHHTTIKLLTRICEEIDKTNTLGDIERIYCTPFCLAAENNIPEAIEVLATNFSGLYDFELDGHDIYQSTVLNRSEKVYSYILHHGPDTVHEFLTSRDSDGNNILHLAGRLAPIQKLNVASGAALQMQQELQWFEEVKKIVPLAHTREMNNNQQTPMMVFRKEHENLRKDGEEWMKKTADSYTITAALIITIVFAAIITVPGGNDSATGKPIYETKASLIIFAISDAISLFTSITSLLLFLSILTARYADEDFLYMLPTRLIIGLVMLFMSVTSMTIAFSAALYIMFGQGKQWILIPIGALACLPVASFVKLQFPLLLELTSSTYGHGIFGKKIVYMKSSAKFKIMKRN